MDLKQLQNQKKIIWLPTEISRDRCTIAAGGPDGEARLGLRPQAPAAMVQRIPRDLCRRPNHFNLVWRSPQSRYLLDHLAKWFDEKRGRLHQGIPQGYPWADGPWPMGPQGPMGPRHWDLADGPWALGPGLRPWAQRPANPGWTVQKNRWFRVYCQKCPGLEILTPLTLEKWRNSAT
jgi:hypothetical protein